MGESVKNYSEDTNDIGETDIEVFLPNKLKNNNGAVIICPGGAYTGWMMNEVRQLAEWLQSKGYTAVVLKYRLPYGRKNVPLADLKQTIRFLKFKSDEWGISPDKIGVAGLSAGGHLAAMASTFPAESDLRPAFSILVYPVISFVDEVEEESRKNLLGQNFSEQDIADYSVENRVTAQTPPAILFLSSNDSLVLPSNSIKYYNALNRNKVPVALYMFPTGNHGWSFTKKFEYNAQTFSLLESWLNNLNL